VKTSVASHGSKAGAPTGSRSHQKVTGASSEPKPMTALVLCAGSAGCVGMVVSGGVRSITKAWRAGVGSTTPCSSMARTAKRCSPSARSSKLLAPPSQSNQSPPSMRHWKRVVSGSVGSS